MRKIQIPFEITATGHLVVTLEYQSRPLRLLLDTASGANVLSEKSASQLKLQQNSLESDVRGLGTSNYKKAALDSLNVSYRSRNIELTDLIAMDLSNVNPAGGDKGMDGLLGSPFFRAYNAVIDFSTKQLTIDAAASP